MMSLTFNRSRVSLRSPDAINEAERAFLTSHSHRRNVGGNRGNLRSSEDIMVAPGLSDFDDEIGIYKLARDNIRALPDLQPVGWILFNFQPIKQVSVVSNDAMQILACQDWWLHKFRK